MTIWKDRMNTSIHSDNPTCKKCGIVSRYNYEKRGFFCLKCKKEIKKPKTLLDY